MSRETMMEKLVGEIYAATHYDEREFQPMDRRRVKRAANIMDSTSYAQSTEILNRIISAEICSIGNRRIA